MLNSTSGSASRNLQQKPARPADFPLFAHDSGAWAKKIRGKLHYFGSWRGAADGNWQKALALYEAQIGDLLAGRKPKRQGRKLKRPKHPKPSPDFPLFAHAAGYWAKKVKGKVHYFGKVATDPKGQAALNKWLEEKDALLAGLTPRTKASGLTIADLCDKFLKAKDHQLASGEITARHRRNYEATTDKLVAHFGKDRLVLDLAADDFESLRARYAEGLGPVSIGNFVQHVRIVFKYGYDAGLIDRPVRYGPMFKRPSKKVMRLARAEKGPKLFTAAEVRTLIDAADVQQKAMILLGINCGFGNADVGTLPLAVLDLDNGWVSYHRPKTGIDRRCKLWPETVEALKAAIAKRPKPKSTDDAGLCFVTKYGGSWAKETTDNPVTKEFRKLLDEQKLHRPGLGFYTLRHVFRTIADESRDQPACDAIMGHSADDMASRYREKISDERLTAVAEHVRSWLWPKQVKGDKGTATSKSVKRPAPKARKVKTSPARRQASAEAMPFSFRIVG